MQVTIIGSLNQDLVTYTDIVPRGGETVLANLFETHLGGKGLNASLAVARLSDSQVVSTRIIGKVGNDLFRNDMRTVLEESGVDTSYLTTESGVSSGVAVITVEEPSGDNRILIAAGANGKLIPTVQDMTSYFTSTDGAYVMMQNEVPCTIPCIEWLDANRPNITTCLNPSPFDPKLVTKDVLSKLGLLIVNEGEAEQVAKHTFGPGLFDSVQEVVKSDPHTGYLKIAQELSSYLSNQGPRIVIVTMGGAGSVYSQNAQPAQYQEAPSVPRVVDTTGAGDTFFGGVVLQLAAGKELADAVAFATQAAGLAIQNNGAASSIPFRKDVDALQSK